MKNHKYFVNCTIFGLLIGTIIGVSVDTVSPGVGVGVGLALGVGIGSVVDYKNKKKNDK